MTVSTSTEPAISEPLAAALRQAESRARADGLPVVTVGHVVAEIVDASARLDRADGVDLSTVADSDALRQDSRPGQTVGQVRRQDERILADARLAARREGSESTAPRHYLQAAALSPGDQLPCLDGSRLLLARAAGPIPGRGVSAQLAVRDVSRAFGDAGSDKAWVRRGRGAVGFLRGQRRSYLEAVEALVLLPGLLVREGIWTLLALVRRNQRWAVSGLGVGGPSGLRDDIPTRARAAMEAVSSLMVFVVGVVAMVAHEVPARVLGLAPAAVGLDIGSELSFLATSWLSGRGALGLGVWLPWALLAVAIPAYETVARIRWGYLLHGGMLLRPWLATMHAVSTLTRPLDRVLGAVGLPASLSSGIVVIAVVTFAVRAFTDATVG